MTDEPLILDIQTGSESTNAARCVIVGGSDDFNREQVIEAIQRAGNSVAVVTGDSPLTRDRRSDIDIGARTEDAIAAALSMAAIPYVPLVKLPERPKQTKAAWRRQMKGGR